MLNPYSFTTDERSLAIFGSMLFAIVILYCVFVILKKSANRE